MPRTPLVLVHGNPESAVIWGPLIDELDRADAVALSPPGFGVPAPRAFDPSMTAYRDWLTSQLELFRAPVDLVGHDWGGIHVAALAMSRPDLIRSWASDALGVFAPDYVWHPRAQVWQQEGPGEASVQELWGGDLQQRLAVTSALGMTGRMAERVAAGMDPEMGRAVLKLLRSARQPAMSEAGQLLPSAAQRPGLALIAVDDFGRASGTLEQHEWAAQRSGAKIARLAGVGHWWPEETPAPVAEALKNFWAELPDPTEAPATGSRG
ncbi:Pimeloyl-ACP methyl ester carboxylesterase [Enhydrobacter aerosaccus]|uniref:Pimeloyl-ACP methyl ester carboxylesterase n=1 Tax=Enhydrobacter aerosaccus TaxID=225324 RepID=A0A1T4LMU9_9HYPH|nr:alpha/beta hydrolase [Enhydrobacter aerosaccus]SJZ56070.1 Pimeloyl-ACP methyl ester carboxylesterase [Enhydrobacter aerosaccus]